MATVEAVFVTKTDVGRGDDGWFVTNHRPSTSRRWQPSKPFWSPKRARRARSGWVSHDVISPSGCNFYNQPRQGRAPAGLPTRSAIVTPSLRHGLIGARTARAPVGAG